MTNAEQENCYQTTVGLEICRALGAFLWWVVFLGGWLYSCCGCCLLQFLHILVSGSLFVIHAKTREDQVEDIWINLELSGTDCQQGLAGTIHCVGDASILVENEVDGISDPW